LGIEPIVPPELASPIAPLPPPPTLSPTRRVSADDDVRPLTKRRRSGPIVKRDGTLISSMVINLDAGRIALLSPEGPPVCGDVSTDLDVGSYTLTPDIVRKQWVFDSGQVKGGRRFKVLLEGAEPFSLVYVPALNLTVTRGIAADGVNSLEDVRKQIVEAVSDGQADDAFLLLDALSSIDLYDVVEDIWADEPGIVKELLLKFEATLNRQPYDMTRILCALESVAVGPEKLFVDSFMRYYIEPKSFSPDKEREKAGKTNVMLRFEYWLEPERAIIVYADDIHDTDVKHESSPQYREGCLLYPAYFTRGSTPRMWDAKLKSLAEIEKGNFEFIQEAAKASMHVINFVFLANSLLAGTIPAVGGAKPSPRPISEAFKKQPGRWLHDFEAGTNMSETEAAYEARVCNKDPGLGYYVNGVQFDGFQKEVLIDAKYYTSDSRMTKALLKNNAFLGNKLLAQADRQVMAAGGRQVEWRVASQSAADKLKELFERNETPVRVVFAP
jgi:hypothetical protein